ncbi:MAG: ATP synthase subunit I [Burkholderiales bacterium]
MLNRIKSKPMRVVLVWQVVATALIALGAGVLAGWHAAISAILGGGINQIADLAYALLVSGSGIRTAGNTLRTLFRAEGVRILLIVLLLGGVLTSYPDVVHPALFLSFVVSVMVFRAAILVKE